MRTLRQLFCGLLIAGMSVCLTGCGKQNTEIQETTSMVEASENTSEETEEVTTAISTETLSDQEDDVEGKIVVWVESSALKNTKYAEYKKEFESNYPGTEVEYKVVSNYEIGGYQSILKGNAGDVVMIPNCMTKEEIKEYFIPFGTTQEIGKKYKEKYIHRMDYDGVVYGIPEYIMPQGIAYNKRVLEYAGVEELPTTPEGFLDMLTAIQIKEEGIIPFYVDEASLEDWQTHVWGSVTGDVDYHYNGMIEDEAPFTKDSPNYVVNRLLYDIVYNGLCQTKKLDNTHAKQLLNRGDIACMMVEFKDLKTLQDAGTNPDDIGFMPFPYNIDGKQYTSATYGYCYGIPLDSQNKKTAEAFVKYMLKESGYAASEGAISLKKKTSKPVLLSDFTGVELVLDNPATDENDGLYQNICEKSGMLLEKGIPQKEIIEVAKNARKKSEPVENEEEEDFESKNEETVEETTMPADFDELMEQWNQKWKKARNTVMQ